MSETVKRLLKFSCIETTGMLAQLIMNTFTLSYNRGDDDDAPMSAPNRNLGEIELKIFDVKITNRERREARVPSYLAVPDNEKVHERSKKAGTHRVRCEYSLERESISFRILLQPWRGGLPTEV